MPTVIVTGGGRGIGAAITRAFHEAGASIVIMSRANSGLALALGERTRFIAGDVRRPEAHRAAVASAITWTGSLDVYVNCAGFSAWRTVGTIDESFLGEMVDINLKGTFWGCQAAADCLGHGGTIINISSLAGKRGSANNSAYCATKFAVNGVTQALAKELGPRGIRVNALCPVYVDTDGVRDALADRASPAAGADIDSYLAEFAAGNAALRRLPTGDEVGRACVFLASSQASAITGQCINVDCGVLPQ